MFGPEGGGCAHPSRVKPSTPVHSCSTTSSSSPSSCDRNSRSRAATGATITESSSLPGCVAGPSHSLVNQEQEGSRRRAPPMQIRPSCGNQPGQVRETQ